MLCEKAAAINAKEVEEIIAASQKNNCFFMEAFWTQFNPSFVDLFSKIEKGDLGEIHYLNADFGFIVENPGGRHIELNLGGGSLLDMGVYPYFLAYMILGKSKKVMASSLFFETGADRQTTMVLHYLKAQAVLQSSFIS